MKDIKGYEGLYAITEDGQVWSYKRKRFLKSFNNGFGYLKVNLCLKGHNKKYFIHRLVAETYIPNPDNLQYINHIDEDKYNCNVSNLEWCDARYNLTYGSKQKALIKSTTPTLVYCPETDTVYPSQAEAARQLGIHKQSVYNCLHGLSDSTASGYHFLYANTLKQ